MSAAASPFKLYPHQEDAVEAIVAALQTDDRTQAIMACGTGKTFTGQRAAEKITKDNPDAITLVTVPNMVLVDQLMREWIAQVSPGLEFRAQPVVSEAASEATRAAAAKQDEIVGFELRDNTTDPQRLAAFMLASGRRIIFSTYQSSDRIAEAVAIAKKSRPAFAIDLIVADEAHRTAGPGTKTEAGLFKTILDDTKIDAAKRLFMTATPRQSRIMEGARDIADFSMGNVAVYGKRATTLSLKWAVRHGHLAPYRAFVAQVSDTDVEEILRKDKALRVTGPKSKTAIRARATQVAAAIVLVKAAKQRDLGSIVTYHSSIRGAEEFKIILNHVVAALPSDSKPSGKLSVEHINGLTPAEDRAAYLATLDSTNRKPGDWSVVTNCNCLTEGVNVPSMDAIMLVDPRSSNVSIVQAVGRPMRKDKNRPRKVASILLPVFVGQLESTDEVIESGAFSSVYLALQALKDHDEALPDMFINELADRESRDPQGPGTTDQRPIVVELLPDEDLPNDELVDSEEPADPTQSDSLPLIRITDHNGESLPGQPKDAVVTIMAPVSHGGSGSVSMSGSIDWHKALTLRVLDDNADWCERGLAALRAYFAVEGHARVPADFVSDASFKLGLWVSNRRVEYKKGLLSRELILELESFSGWTWDPVESDRLVGLSALGVYAAEHGHARVLKSHVSPDRFKLGSWVSNRRADYKSGKLSPELILELESFSGWTWDPAESDRLAGLSALHEYAVENGHARVPYTNVSPEGFKLGSWVSNRRTDYKSGKLSPELILELESFSGWTWDPAESDRLAGLSALHEYAVENGHARVPHDHVSQGGFKLGKWVGGRRMDYKAGQLAIEFVSDLESVAGWTWNRYESDRLAGLSALHEYAVENGHARVPYTNVSPEGFKLGSWVSNRRTDYKAGQLSPELILELESFSGWTWDPFESDRLDGLSALREYEAENGRARVPGGHVSQSGFKLGKWVARRRQELKTGKLPEPHIADLDSISTSWRNGTLAPWESATGVMKDEPPLAA